jgi:hypothetical protein
MGRWWRYKYININKASKHVLRAKLFILRESRPGSFRITWGWAFCIEQGQTIIGGSKLAMAMAMAPVLFGQIGQPPHTRMAGLAKEGGLFRGGHLGWQGALEEAPAGVWGIVRTA